MDHYLLIAAAVDRDGNAGAFRVRVSERDSECTSREEWAFRLLRAADRAGVRITGEMRVEDDPTRGRGAPESETPPGQGGVSINAVQPGKQPL